MTRHRILKNGLLLVVGWCTSIHAANLTVCSSATYKTIGAALTASAPGDEIDICPGLYAEQLVVTQPVTLHGMSINGIQRVMVQPAALTNAGNLSAQAVISVVNTYDVFIDGLAIDASQNTVVGCTVTVAGVHFYNSSGSITNNAISGAQLSSPQSCNPKATALANGFGVQVDTSSGQTGSFSVEIRGNSIHDFNRDGILVTGSGIRAEISGNTVAGVGPSTGYFQFGIYVGNGAVGHVMKNVISQGNCGSLAFTDCVNVRSEGVVFKAVGDGSVVDSNFIVNAQSGIFLNGANRAQITNNTIVNIDALDGIDIQGTASGFFTNSVISGNTISHVFPISNYSSVNFAGCGINEFSGTGVAMNLILDNTVNDAYCGVAFVTADQLFSGTYMNTLFATLNEDLYPNVFPPAVEPQ